MNRFEIEDKVREFVELAAYGLVRGFYPTAVAKYAGISTKNAFEFLLKLVDEDKLVLKWELRCPEHDCFKIIEITNNREKIDYANCPRCGSEFEPKLQDFFPRFEINKCYREYIQEKDKKKSDNSLSVKSGNPISVSEELLKGLSVQQQDILKKSAPYQVNIVINQLQYNEKSGEMIQDNKSITDSFNGQISGQVTVQSDHVKQKQSIGINDKAFDEQYKKLIEDIMKMEDESQKETAKYLAEQLKEAYEKKEKAKGLRIIDLFKGTISTSAALASLAHIFGLI